MCIPNSFGIVILVDRDVVVNYKTTPVQFIEEIFGKDLISGDEDTGWTVKELLYSLIIIHLIRYNGNTEAVLLHLATQLNNTLISVAIDDGPFDV